jgi:transcriptional regulator with PAS, ATPase and Fis domain
MYLRKSLKEALDRLPEKIERGTTILIYGETGSGKEVLARKIYEKLKIKGSFVPVDCSSITDTLFESGLFGHKKGSFTGAINDKQGLVEIANNGLLFFDEVANIPLQIQVKLLRLLETKKFRRVGETEERKSEFLLVCATNKDLWALVEKREFREDLYFRINKLEIRLKPLREEKQEIFNLINHFINQKIKFTKRAIEYILCYPWRGNIRELKSCCEYIISKGKEKIDINGFPEKMLKIWCPEGIKIKKDKKIKDILKNVETETLKILIKNHLEQGGDIKGLCEELECSRAKVCQILKKLGIKTHFKKGRPKKCP